VKQDEIIGIRIPHKLRAALEQKRQRMSKAAGAEIKTSAVVRSILERDLIPARRSVARRSGGAVLG
jgi:hypothetical protein